MSGKKNNGDDILEIIYFIKLNSFENVLVTSKNCWQ